MSLDRLKLFIPLLLFIVIALVFLALEKRMGSGDYDPSALPSALIGQPVPAFELSALADSSVIKTVADIEMPALLNVWATWCVSCRVEHPYLNSLAESGIRIYGLNYKDDRSEALRWLQQLGDPYTLVLFDEEGILGLNLGVYGAPETYVLDEDGIIRYRHVGVMDKRVWQKTILPLGIAW
jgi:cytochrome c biogenesis protein CcmG/thiol:disulfide interchange protein DsbE